MRSAYAYTYTDGDTYYTNTNAYACCHPDSKTDSDTAAAPNTASATVAGSPLFRRGSC